MSRCIIRLKANSKYFTLCIKIFFRGRGSIQTIISDFFGSEGGCGLRCVGPSLRPAASLVKLEIRHLLKSNLTPDGTPYNSAKLHPVPCSTVGIPQGTVTQTHTRVTNIHFESSTTHAKCNDAVNFRHVFLSLCLSVRSFASSKLKKL